MSVSTKLGDEFLHIPKLDVSGTNWVIFKDRFTWALDARGILDHIEGTSIEPVDPIPEAVRKKGTVNSNWRTKEIRHGMEEGS